MHTTVKLLALFLNCILIHGQTCDFSSYHECMRQSFESEQQKPNNDQDRFQLDQQIKNCFITSGCKEPNFIEDTNQGSRPGGTGGPPVVSGLDNRRECYRKNHQKAEEVVEKCVQQTIPNFHFNNDDEGNKRDSPRDDGRGGGITNNMALRINQSCPDQTSRTKVNNCMRQLWEKPDNPSANDPQQRRKEVEDRFKRMCDKKANCFKAMTPECQLQFNNTKTVTCNCAQSDLLPKRDQFDRELDSCLASTGQPSQPSGRRKKSSIDMTMRRMCPDKDQCEKGFPSEAQAGPHRPRFPGGH